jgi:hypothetical protein
VAALLLCLGTAGCRSGSTPLAAVHGRVFYRGQALQRGTIVFAPDETRGCRGELACAEIQADGSYILKTGDALGAVPGWHHVTISCVMPAAPAPPGQPYAYPLSLLPPRYRDPQLSGLACEVKADRTNSIDFQLD